MKKKPDPILDRIVDCCNAECNWRGKVRDCVCMKHDTQPLCPLCHEVTEPLPEDNAP